VGEDGLAVLKGSNDTIVHLREPWRTSVAGELGGDLGKFSYVGVEGGHSPNMALGMPDSAGDGPKMTFVN